MNGETIYLSVERQTKCDGLKCFEDYAEGRSYADDMEAAYVLNSVQYEVYQCRFCEKWHMEWVM